MSSWTPAEVLQLKANGNDKARATWLAKAPPPGQGGRPQEGSDINVFKAFIVDVYERKKYYREDGDGSSSAGGGGSAVAAAPQQAPQQHPPPQRRQRPAAGCCCCETSRSCSSPTDSGSSRRGLARLWSVRVVGTSSSGGTGSL